jgi:hypothetical protein
LGSLFYNFDISLKFEILIYSTLAIKHLNAGLLLARMQIKFGRDSNYKTQKGCM